MSVNEVKSSWSFRRLYGAPWGMSFDEHMARAAECQQKAKLARSDGDKLSWLTLADSWLKTAELQQLLKRQSQFLKVTP
jgi:hypothetical protein